MNETNELQVFEQQNIAIFQQLADFKKQKEAMEEAEKQIKANLKKAMEDYGITSFKNDVISLSYVEASTSESLDTKTMQEKEPKLYADLLKDYPKVKTTSAYVRIMVK